MSIEIAPQTQALHFSPANATESAVQKDDATMQLTGFEHKQVMF